MIKTKMIAYQTTKFGQVTLEYFILFAALALLTVIGVTTFHTDVKNAVQGFFNAAATEMAK